MEKKERGKEREEKRTFSGIYYVKFFHVSINYII